jgi:PadR family transcriptional regulator, regulatory protein PadR
MSAPDTLGVFEEIVLLAILHLGDEAYGTTIRREIEARTGRSIAVGALYTALDRLERKGFIASQMSDPTPERGGRSKRYVRLQPAGRAALRQSRALMDRMWRGIDASLRRTRS